MKKQRSISIVIDRNIRRHRSGNKIMKTTLIKSCKDEIERLVIQADMNAIIAVVEEAEYVVLSIEI